ncbi:MAG: ComF family protein [Neisseriaceae bacterium]|nr:ComF family protein [Neisseriaceae bacterium]
MKIFNKISNILNNLPLADCPLCHETAEKNGLCAACWQDLQTLLVCEPVCPHCAEPNASGKMCGQCQKNPPNFDALYAAFRYEEPFITLVHRWKYQAALQYSGVLSTLLQCVVAKMPQNKAFDCIVSVPPSHRRLVEHGFDHTAVLAKALSKQLNVPIISPKLIERQHRVPQASLNRKQRMSNLKNSFTLHLDAHNKNILLLDDIATTGSTLNELSGCLKKQGAKSVTAAVLSRRYRQI